MSVYHQMGHDSWNLLQEQGLSLYKGAILSPVNDAEEKMAERLGQYRTSNAEVIFDPQLYYPRTERGVLSGWRYFPKDVDSADFASRAWWRTLITSLSEVPKHIPIHSICSPAVITKSFPDDYYAVCNNVYDILAEKVAKRNVKVLYSLVTKLGDLSQPGRSETISSIVSASSAERVYLVLLSDINPRLELRDTEDLKGAMRLISLLEESGVSVLVGFSSSDIVLWKYAGASACATGKFFNLRRFTPSRFEPPPGGGGQIPYWFEEALMAFTRESDLTRIRHAGKISSASESNPFGKTILDILDRSSGQAWLAESWRQYMYWFADFEKRVSAGVTEPKRCLVAAEKIWRELDEAEILMEEPTNDGGWLRPWRRALAEAFPSSS